MPFYIIFILVPLAEIFAFIAVADEIGLFTAFLLAVAMAVLGGFIVKYQGLQTILNIHKALHSGGLPPGALFDGLCLVAAGALLIVPGFLTDIAAFLLLIPAVRGYLRKLIRARTTWFAEGTSSAVDTVAIEGTYETIDPNDKPQ